jgi:hypothetical protein
VAIWPKNESNWPDNLFDHIFDLSKELPDPREYPDAVWPKIVKSLLTRMIGGIQSILEHATNRQTAWLRLGGAGGVVAAIRVSKFCYCIMRANLCNESLAEDITKTSQALSNILSQEAWRRWALVSFVEADDIRVNDLFLLWQLFMEAILNADLDREAVCLHFLHHHWV